MFNPIHSPLTTEPVHADKPQDLDVILGTADKWSITLILQEGEIQWQYLHPKSQLPNKMYCI